MVSLTVVALLITVGLATALAAVAWRYREKRGAKFFALLQAVSAVWVGVTILGLRTPPGPLRVRLWGVTTGLSLLIIVLWLGFILNYTGRDSWLTPRRIGVVSLPLVAGALCYFVAPTSTPLIGEVTQETIEAGTVVQATVGQAGLVLAGYAYLVFLIGLWVVGKTVLEGPRLFVGQALAFVVGSLFTIVASFLVILKIPVPGYPLTQIAVSGQAALWGYAVFGQQLLQAVPAVAEIGERAIFDDLDEGILVVDDAGTVVQANPRARSFVDSGDPIGRPFGQLFAGEDVPSVDALPMRFEREGEVYRIESSRLRDWRDQPVGHAVTLRDVTQLVTRQQRLTVLNRILRHNVRNDMNVVLGIGTELSDHDDASMRSHGETLRRKADELTDISSKAIEIDRMFDASTDEERTHLPTLIDDVVAPLAARHPDATVETDVDPDVIRTDPHILSSIVTEVVENVFQHAGDAPEMTVEATSKGTHARITVADDGPGIPDVEVASITGDERTAVHHASGIGLWLVYWGVQVLDGEVDIATGAAGSVVTLRIPDTGDSARE